MLRECHVNYSGECHVSRSATWMIGRGLSLFAETSVSLRLGGWCTVSSPGIDQSQSQSQGQNMVGPLKGAQGKKVNRSTA